MRVLHFVSDVDETHGGPAQSVPRLAGSLNKLGCDCSIVYIGDGRAQNEYLSESEIDVLAVPALGPGSLALSLTMRSTLQSMHSRKPFDIVHIHSMWRLSAMSVWRFARSAGVPHVVSPRSNLYTSSLTRSSFKKGIARKLYVDEMLRTSAFIHATEVKEEEAVRDLGYPRVVNIPNGLDVPEGGTDKTFRPGPKRKFLFLSRVHPRKRPELLIAAFAKLASIYPDISLTIAGPCESTTYLKSLKAQAEALGCGGKILFPGMLRGEAKEAAYRDADVFVLPSDFENFGISVGEAMARRVPVITTDGTPWGFLNRSAGRIMRVGSGEDLYECLSDMVELPDEDIVRYGENAIDVSQQYSWFAASQEMMTAYSGAKFMLP